MNNVELEAYRRLLFFSVAEAADQIGECSHRSWQRWEDGTRNIPDRVSDQIKVLVEWRNKALSAARSEIALAYAVQGEPEKISLLWYESLDSWLTSPDPNGSVREAIKWRPQQSVTSAILADYPCATLTIV
jgi:hypothetical protein